MILKIAWKNVWDKRIHTLILIARISIILAGSIIFFSFINAIILQRINSVINIEHSHIQIHNNNFLEKKDINLIINDNKNIIKNLEKDKQIYAISGRIIVMGMASTANSGSDVKIYGIHTNDEALVSNLYSKLTSSTYFNTYSHLPIIIGKELAKELKIKRKSNIILSFKSSKNELTGATFKVIGIYKTANSKFNNKSVFVLKEDIAKLSQLNINSNHEIAIILNENKSLEEISKRLKSEFSDSEVTTWKEKMPKLAASAEHMSLFYYSFIMIILIGIAVITTKSILKRQNKRKKEFATLICIGTSKKQISYMTFLEHFIISIIGATIGFCIASIFIYYFAEKGIDLSIFSDLLENWGFESIIFPTLNISLYFGTAILIIIITSISAIYTSIKQKRIHKHKL